MPGGRVKPREERRETGNRSFNADLPGYQQSGGIGPADGDGTEVLGTGTQHPGDIGGDAPFKHGHAAPDPDGQGRPVES